MGTSPLSLSSEQKRLRALYDRAILDTQPEREFDELTRLASVALGTASSAISLIDADRQWFKSRHGISFTETPREIAFCAHALSSPEILVVPDARLDSRFSDNPLVEAEGGIRFYAGAPLIVGSGHRLGTLCVFDSVARAGLTASQRGTLQDLARLATDLIESRQSRRTTEIAGEVIEATSDAILAADLDGTIVFWNPAAERLFGRPAAEAVGQNVDIVIPRHLATGHRDIFARAAAGGPTRLVGTSVELAAARADGTEFPVELSLARWGTAGSERGFAAIVRDVTERKAAEREREHARSFLDSVVTNLPALLSVKDRESGRYVMMNRFGEQLLGIASAEIVGRTDEQLFRHPSGLFTEYKRASADAGGPDLEEQLFVGPTGDARHLLATRAVIDGPEGAGQYVLTVAEDVTARKAAEAEVHRLAHYDALTGLLNRASHSQRLADAVCEGVPLALLSIDLDGFKTINDRFGQRVGDEVLAEIGQRLRAAVHGSDWVARVGGDEFIIVLVGGQPRIRAQEIADEVAMRLRDRFSASAGIEVIAVSVGVVLFPEDGATPEQLSGNVDLALSRAKQDGGVCFFNAEIDALVRNRRALARDVRLALDAREFTLMYQPVVSTRTGQISSAEALARWEHPTRGPVSPDEFIPLAEQCHLIDELGEQLLRRACLDATEWPPHVRVAVNLSPRQFQTGRLVETVRSCLAQSGLAPHRLQLEVTESLLIQDVEATFSQLDELRRSEIQILLDDFGVGYSSLSYFQKFQFDKVKIDKSFVRDIVDSRASEAVVRAVVGLGERLGMGVVAEGVETEAQRDVLVSLGCTHLQGYLFSRPLPGNALKALLGARTDRIRKSRAA